MKNAFICPFLLLATLFFHSCENSYRNRGQAPTAHSADKTIRQSSSPQGPKVGMTKDAYQVTAAEFDEFFDYRYGLLYQKFSDSPFTGRIVTISKGEAGDFVSMDESWKDGRKDGVSTRWFSNGIKMYERNYDQGKWHGSVTRWWPNGQKMYVRAYTKGKRHGKEATWRSDGTPIDLIAKESSPPNDAIPSVAEDQGDSAENELPSVFIPTDDAGAEPAFEPFSESSLPEPPSEPEMSDAPVFEPLAEPNLEEAQLPAVSESPADLPPLAEPELPGDSSPPADAAVFTPMEEEGLPATIPEGDDLPPLPGSDESGLPPLPEAEIPQASSDGLPPLMPDSSLDAGLPPLPADEAGGLPPLPGEGSDLPPLPEDGGLPPLPGDGELPPLPELP